jgi:hypothetical protein
MNNGTHAGAGNGSSGGAITGFQQSHIIKSSQVINPPPGTKRIEALMCGGGGSGSPSSGGGGFGGLAVMGIPVTGHPYSIVVGAGGTNGYAGSPSQVWSAGMMYAEVGGGGGAYFYQYNAATYENRNGRSGGSGAGSYSQYFGGNGGTPPIGNILWYYAPATANINWFGRNTAYPQGLYGTSNAGWGAYYNANSSGFSLGSTHGSNGGGGGGGSAGVGPSYGGGGGGGEHSYSSGLLGGGGGAMTNGSVAAGGSLTSVSIWGITGKANGNGVNGGAGGGGGLLGAGLSGSYTLGEHIGFHPDVWDWAYLVNYIGGDGGDGGGGGGGAYYPPPQYINYNIYQEFTQEWKNVAGPNLRGGNGGNGFVILRFFF